MLGAWIDPSLGQEEGRGRHAGCDTQQNGCCVPEARSGLSHGIQPASFTPTQKTASGRLDTPHVALFGPSVVTQVERPDPRASGARGVARQKARAGKRGGAGARGLDSQQNGCCGPEARSGLSPGMQPAAFTPTQVGCFGEAGPPHVALFGPSVITQVQRSDPRSSGARGVARPNPGPGRGAGPAQGDMTPSKGLLRS